MPQQADAALHERVLRHYLRCVEAIRDGDVEGFLDWLGPDGSFVAVDGATVRVPDTRPFWAWRFASVIAVRRVEIEVESVKWNDDGLVEVDFHEESDLTVRGFDGDPVERDADLHIRNYWEISEKRLTFRGGEEIDVRRSIDGRPLTDDIDPWGFAAWARHQQQRPR